MGTDAGANSGAGSNAGSPTTPATPKRTATRGLLDEINMMLTSPYYALNIILAASYVVTREWYRLTPIRQDMLFLGEVNDYESWERYVAFLCGSYGLFRSIKARSRLAGLTAILDYTQLFVAIMAMVCSPVLLAYLVLGYSLIYLIFPQPMYPLHDTVEVLTPESFLEDVKQPGTDVTWVVIFYAPWHPVCRNLAPDMADLATRYGTDKLRFAMMDLGEYSKSAAKLGIDMSPVSHQLPSIVLYEKGEEVSRIPQKKANGALYGAGFKTKDIVKVLELDMRFARSMQKAGEKKGQ